MRARQTPYPFHDLPAAEEEEEEEEVIHPMTVRKDQPCCDSALIQALIKRLIAQGDEIRHRTVALHAEYRTQLEVYYTPCRRIDEGFKVINDRMDAQHIKIRELQAILYEQHQRLENSIHTLQAVGDENNERVLFILNDQLREQ